MPRDAASVEDLGPFDTPTATEGTEINNSGDGRFWTEIPSRPAAVGIINRSGGAATVTFSVAPAAPGTPVDFTTSSLSNASMLCLPPGFLPQLLFRRDDGQSTNPGTIYVDASATGVYLILVRGPGYPRRSSGSGGLASIGGSRTVFSSQRVRPLEEPSVGSLITDTDGVGFAYSGCETIFAYRGAGTQTLTLTRNPSDPFGGTADVEVTSDANEGVLFPPGVPHPDLVRRNNSTDPGVLYLSSDQAASTRLCVVALNGRKPE